MEIVALINDTVGTMVAAAYESEQCDLGVIIGRLFSYVHQG